MEHVTGVSEIESAHKDLFGKREGNRPLGSLCKSGRIILKWIFVKQLYMIVGLIGSFSNFTFHPLIITGD
jgi:hypothetical protein